MSNRTPTLNSSRARLAAMASRSVAGPKRGDALFEGTSYPRTWDDYIGQDDAVDYLRATAASAKARGRRLDHVLIATGAHGIGKSALARLIASEMDAGLIEVQGVVDEKEAMRIFAGMSDGDILFYDEFHMAVSKGRAKAEWLLSVLQDGVLVTGSGVTAIPDVTVIAATTDIQKVPETIISRFTVKPTMESYTREQAEIIVRSTARREWKGLELEEPNDWVCRAIADASNNNPRAITQLLRTLRDCILSGNALVGEGGLYGLDKMYQWAGVTTDGLDKTAQEYLMVLLAQFNGAAGEKAIAAALGEPTAPRHTEKLLLQKGFITIKPTGRELTPDGTERAMELAADFQEA